MKQRTEPIVRIRHAQFFHQSREYQQGGWIAFGLTFKMRRRLVYI